MGLRASGLRAHKQNADKGTEPERRRLFEPRKASLRLLALWELYPHRVLHCVVTVRVPVSIFPSVAQIREFIVNCDHEVDEL